MKHKLLPRLKLSADRNLSAQIYDFLREMIITMEVLPGAPLSENDLAAHFGVSRHPVREALGRLGISGLIEVRPQRGSFVTKISMSNLSDICFVRSSIELNALRRGLSDPTSAATKGAIAAMRRCLERQRKLGNDDATRFLRLDDSFHEALCSMSGTAYAWQCVQQVKANMDRIRFLSIGKHSSVTGLVACHERIMEAVEGGDLGKVIEVIEPHHYEIVRTSQAIHEESAEWFVGEGDA
ncbi:MAG: GntR family transcriptional regulator [Succinivibrionaceae bacterium]|nr:GntR family transcriptional regulator [Succinivibrionaceae bacterium]